MVPLPHSPDGEQEEDDLPSDSDDSEEELFLSSLAQSLAEPPPKRPCIRSLPTPEDQVSGHSPTEWPEEVKIVVVACLPWREVAKHAQISRAWRSLEQCESLWEKYVRIEWPRLFHRKVSVATSERRSWRMLFRQRWAQGYRSEDAEEEHWKDLNAALDLCTGAKAKKVLVKSLSEEQQVQHALRRFKEDRLRLNGVEVGGKERCVPECEYCAVPIDGELALRLFVCERCADVHICRPRTPCEGATLSMDSAYLVCSVSGICCANHIRMEEETDVAVAVNDWDPELSVAQQHGRWFEQGYFMSEEQADEFFGDRDCRKARSSGCSRWEEA
jgi:hypothetical protein